MSRSAIAAVIAASTLALLPGLAAAQANTAEASLSGYGYKLIDLDLNDGIMPSLTLSNVLQGAVATGTPSGGQSVEHEQWSETGEPVVAQVGLPGAGSAAWFSAEELKASGAAGNGHYFSIAGWDADYTLSANTKLVFTGRATGAIESSGSESELAYAVVSASFKTFGLSAADQIYFHSVNSLEPASGTSFDDTFQIEFVNDSASALQGTMSLVARTTVWGVSPVPEPATWLMLGAGLAVSGAIARRRQLASGKDRA